MKQIKLERLHSENITSCPMITHIIYSYRIPFIPSQNFVVGDHDYKSTHPTQAGTYVKFGSSGIKMAWAMWKMFR